MTFDLVMLKIQEFARWFFNFAMYQGENNLMLVNSQFLIKYGFKEDMIWYYVCPLVAVALFTIFASDSFHPFSLHDGILSWFKKISILKVTIFAASIFSLHTFYKMLITLAGNFAGAKTSVLALECLGTYINPFSICIFSIAVATLDLLHSRRQMFFLGLCVFLTPALLKYDVDMPERIVLYSIGVVLAIAGVFLYRKFSIYVTYLIMSVIYLISKFFMIFYSKEIAIFAGKNVWKIFVRYTMCIELDILLILIIALILFCYKEFTSIRTDVVIDSIWVSIIAVVLVFSIVATMTTTAYATSKYSDAWTQKYNYNQIEISSIDASSFLTSSSGNNYGPENLIDGDLATSWRHGAKGKGQGEKINLHFDGEQNVGLIRISNGSKRSIESYENNCRAEEVKIVFYKEGKEVVSLPMQMCDSFYTAYSSIYVDSIVCDAISIEFVSVFEGIEYDDLCVSEVIVYEVTDYKKK